MNTIQRFAARRPIPFVIAATVIWVLVAGVVALMAACLLDTSFGSALAQSLGTLTATACLVLLMWRWGWLRAAGVARLGSWRLWLATAGLVVYISVAYQLAFFGQFAIDMAGLWASGEAQKVLARQAVVGAVEEILFRGFLLYALVRLWGGTRRGALAALTVPALIFGLMHILQAAGGNPLDDTLMTMLSSVVTGLGLGALVLLGGSVWPAVLIHAASNATVQLGALSLRTFDPSVADFAAATAVELPLLAIGLWLLLRKGKGLIPMAGAESFGTAGVGVSTTSRVLILVMLAGIIVLGSCADGAPPTPTPTAVPTPTPAPTPTLVLKPTPVIENRLSAAERAEIFEAVWQTVNDNYFDPTFGGQDWQAVGDAYRQKLATVQDDRAFWVDVLNPMLFGLGVSHMGALPPELSSQMDPMTFSAGTLGMDVRSLDGQVVITEVTEGFPAAQAGLKPGLVITALNGRTPEQIAAEALQPPPDNERNRRANLVQNLRTLLYGEPGDEIEMRYLDENGQTQDTTLRYAERSASTCVQFDPNLPPACTEFEMRRLAGGVGYLRFSAFLPTALDSVLQAIEELHDAPALIIDLRGNPGGVFPVRKAIASQLVGERTLFMRYQLRDEVQEAYLDVVADPYPGLVVILVDELSASSSEEFAGSLQALGRATIVGSQTPGRCLVSNVVQIPSGAILSYPFGQSQTPDGRVLEGNGVVPDVEVALDRVSLLQGIDTQLEAAIEYVADQIGQ